MERTTPNGHAPEHDGRWPGYVPIHVKYHGGNPQRIYAACPRASDVRGFHDWLKAGRAVQKGEKGIPIYVPARRDDDEPDDERRPRVKRAYVFDVSHTAPIVEKSPAAV